MTYMAPSSWILSVALQPANWSAAGAEVDTKVELDTRRCLT